MKLFGGRGIFFHVEHKRRISVHTETFVVEHREDVPNFVCLAVFCCRSPIWSENGSVTNAFFCYSRMALVDINHKIVNQKLKTYRLVFFLLDHVGGAKVGIREELQWVFKFLSCDLGEEKKDSKEGRGGGSKIVNQPN